jgi:endonuclease/exonuclease/phosphatase family metal-dependent hydrolase
MSTESAPIRVLTWNLWKMFGDPLAVHRVLRSAEADLVCLQEAPSRPGSGHRLAALGRATGLHVVAGGRSAAGNAILRSSRIRVHSAEAVRLRPANWRIQRRGVVLATVGLEEGLPFRLAAVHLGLDLAERKAHVAELLTRLRVGDTPAVVAGDLNEATDGRSWQALASVVTDPAPQAPATFSVDRPRHRIDVVLTAPGIETLEYAQWRPDPRDVSLASDHIPVLSVIRLIPCEAKGSN